MVNAWGDETVYVLTKSSNMLRFHCVTWPMMELEMVGGGDVTKLCDGEQSSLYKHYIYPPYVPGKQKYISL